MPHQKCKATKAETGHKLYKILCIRTCAENYDDSDTNDLFSQFVELTWQLYNELVCVLKPSLQRPQFILFAVTFSVRQWHRSHTWKPVKVFLLKKTFKQFHDAVLLNEHSTVTFVNYNNYWQYTSPGSNTKKANKTVLMLISGRNIKNLKTIFCLALYVCVQNRYSTYPRLMHANVLSK